MRARLESYFEFDRLSTDWRTEILAGVTTFVTMAYIIFVNPAILADAGMPVAAVTAATCLAAAIGCLLMGIIARYPIALAPGMGLNAYFAYAVVKGMGVPWQAALGAVFVSGLVFLILTALGIRQLIFSAIPRDLYAAVAAGIGLFIALIGFRNAGLIRPHPQTLLTLGDLHSPRTALALLGLLLMGALMAWRVRGAILIGIVGTTLGGIVFGLVPWAPKPYTPAELSMTWMRLDVAGALKLGLLEIVFVFLFVDLFDNVGTLVAVGTRAGLMNRHGEIPRLGRILTCDALATTAGSLLGTSTVVSYIESAAGVVAGGRSGVTAIVAGLLFLAAVFIAPLLGVIPTEATAPALIVVGSLMLTHIAEIEWNSPLTAIPAFLTLTGIPFTFSIANGLALGFLAHAGLRLVSGKGRDVHWFVYILAALFLLRFIYLGQE